MGVSGRNEKAYFPLPRPHRPHKVHKKVEGGGMFKSQTVLQSEDGQCHGRELEDSERCVRRMEKAKRDEKSQLKQC